MLKLEKFTPDQLKFAIENGEFHPDVRSAAPLVACLMTQSWCPQWVFMRSWLRRLSGEGGDTEGLEITAYELEYDKNQFFSDFRRLKEQVWNSWEVPYVRYYADGTLIHESNFVSAMTFLEIFRTHR